MRKNAAPFGRAALVAGLLLVIGLAGPHPARAADAQTPWLGVYMQELSPELREGMDYRGDGGVIVTRVVRGGPAEQAGVRNGDLILLTIGEPIGKPGGTNTLKIVRVGERKKA